MILDDVSITELSFGKEYTAAVESKQVGKHNKRRKLKSLESITVVISHLLKESYKTKGR